MSTSYPSVDMNAPLTRVDHFIINGTEALRGVESEFALQILEGGVVIPEWLGYRESVTGVRVWDKENGGGEAYNYTEF